jgi:anti-sigma B factor antagonist
VEVRVAMVTSNDEVFTTWTKELDDGQVSIIYLCGELDASSVPTLLSELHDVVNGKRNIMIDTHLLSYIDSTGLGALFSIKQALQGTGRGLCLVGAHGLLPKILQITRADSEFHCYENADEAMAEAVSPGW